MNKALKWGCGCGCGPFIALFAFAFVIALIEVIFDVKILSDDEPEQKNIAAVDTVEQEKRSTSDTYNAADTSSSADVKAEAKAISLHASTIDSTKKVIVVPHKPDEPYTIKSIPNTRIRGNYIHVSDPDNIIGKEYSDSINRILSNVRDSADIFVVAVDRIDKSDGDEFTHELFNYWGIGDMDKNNGVLVFMTMNPHFIRIETGYGMEGTLPDVTCKRIIRHKVAPLFRQDRYPEGTLECAKALAATVSPDSTGLRTALFASMDAIEKDEAHQRELRMQKEKEEEEKDKRMVLWGLGIVWLIANILVMKEQLHEWNEAKVPVVSKSLPINDQLYQESRIYKTHLDVGWLTLLLTPLSLISYFFIKSQIRKKLSEPRICPHCGKPMRLLSEAEEDEYLSELQQNEEKFRSKNYDVWVCDDCNATRIEDYEADSAKYYIACQHCHAKLAKEVNRVETVKATEYHRGEAKVTYKCLNCGKSFNKRYDIPKKPKISGYSSSSYSDSSDSRSSYSSSSSFSSHSSGSFGGGRSGGGGASSSW